VIDLLQSNLNPSIHPVLDTTVSVANVVALLAVSATVASLINSNWKDRRLAKRTVADQIRNSAALLTVKLERWRDLAASFFAAIQPDITDADIKLVKGKDVTETRDQFWRALGTAGLSISKQVSDEEIELSYASLYGYDPRVRELFLTAIARLKSLKVAIHYETLMQTQSEITAMEGNKATSAELGNKLRNIAGSLEREFFDQASSIIRPFEKEMIRLIEASDREITAKKVQLSSAEHIFPSDEYILGAVRSTGLKDDLPLKDDMSAFASFAYKKMMTQKCEATLVRLNRF
jgi:hypothetical protein